MSERTLLRRFQAATGMTPADWIVRARLDIARELLERTGLSIEQIATRTGLGTADHAASFPPQDGSEPH